MASWAFSQTKESWVNEGWISKVRWSGGVGAALTVGIHVAVIALLLAARTTVISQPEPINVSIISDAQQNQPLEIQPARPHLDQLKLHVPQPEVALADNAPANTAPLATSTPPSSTVVPATAPLTRPVFDADYLKNPAPVYPPLARRMREEGVVLVRVLVSPTGLPDQIELKHSSGSARLDEAALYAVKKWRFVPARRGNQTVAAWVVVPIAFSLTA